MAHTPAAELAKVLAEAAATVHVGATYAHYKHPDALYRVLSLALMEADESVAVVYQQEGGERLTFVRPLASFLEEVETPEGTVLRFQQRGG